MMVRRRAWLAAMAGGSAVLAAALLWPEPARAASFLEKTFGLSGPRYDGALPGCDAALSTVASRFANKEGRFWNSDLEIVGFEHVRETAYRPWADNTIPRRFCSAQALVTDGRRHAVYFSIGEDTAMIGSDWGVDFCVVGFDRGWAYRPGCKMAQP